MFNFTSLLGAQSASPASQSIIEVDGGIKILVDVGWDESFDVGKLKELERQVPTLSLVLLTHATTSHLGAYAHCCKHYPLFTRVPVYATAPVISLGRTLLQDLYASTPLASTVIPTSALSETAYDFSHLRDGDSPNILLQPPTADEIASYFALIHPLKYSQPYQPTSSSFSPPLNGLTITAYSAGHTLGGTIWHIQHGLESIVYAVDWNQGKEHVIPGAAWLGGGGAHSAEVIEQLRRPTAMVCSSKNADRPALPGGRRKRDELLIGLIRETVANGGIVLIPSDSSARVLELAYMLDDAWRTDHRHTDSTSTLKNARLYLASRGCGSTMRYARSMLEWMDEGIVEQLEIAGQNAISRGHTRNSSQQNSRADSSRSDAPRTPFDFAFLKLLERKSHFNRMLMDSSPRVILASDASLEWGFSRDALKAIASDDRNLVILTERAGQSLDAKKGLGRALWELWEERRSNRMADADANTVGGRLVNADGETVSLNTVRTEALGDTELSLYQQFLGRQRQLQTTIQPDKTTTLDNSADAADDRSSTTSESSEESDMEHQGKALHASASMSHSRHRVGMTDAELGVSVLLRQKGVHDFDVRGKKGREKMFPYAAKRKRGDDFGDFIRPEEYLRAEEREEIDADTSRDTGTKKENTLGQKRKWDEVGPRGHRASVTGKRRKSQDQNFPGEPGNADSIDTSDESDSEDAGESNVGPSKVVFSTEELQLNLRIAFVDFSGLHDKQSLQMLIPLIKPRKLVLVGGERDETLTLAADCRKLFGSTDASGASDVSTDVLTPIVGHTVDASVDTNAWVVKLSPSLVRRLQWQNVKGLGVVAITGRLQAANLDAATDDDNDSETATKRQKQLKQTAHAPSSPPPPPDAGTATSASAAATSEPAPIPVLDVVPARMATATRASQPLHVGDLRLADLRKAMLAAGLAAEFRGEGTLLVNGCVAVRKSGTGRIEVEGTGLGDPLPPHGGGAGGAGGARRGQEATFYAVKRKIYEGLAVVAGG